MIDESTRKRNHYSHLFPFLPGGEVIHITETPEKTNADRPFKRLRRARSKQPEAVAAVNPDQDMGL